MKFFYGKYTNIIYEDYDGEFTVEFNADMYGSSIEGWFFSCCGVRYDVWAPDAVTLAAAARLAMSAFCKIIPQAEFCSHYSDKCVASPVNISLSASGFLRGLW